MIIDIHAHVVGPKPFYDRILGTTNVTGLASRSLSSVVVTDDELLECLARQLDGMKAAQADVQLISAPPWAIPTADRRAALVANITRYQNDLTAHAVRLVPDRFAGLGVLPQSLAIKPRAIAQEIARGVNELGFVGFVINPDPGEGSCLAPDFGDEYWYPVFEALVAHDVPVMVHAGLSRHSAQSGIGYACQEQTVAGWSLLRSPEVFAEFPALRVIFADGGGYIPYQYGRARCFRLNERTRGGDHPLWEPFEETLARVFFDTVLFSSQALELLFKVCHSSQCLFGAGHPGDGGEGLSAQPDTAGTFATSIRQHIDAIEWLDESDRDAIYSGNAFAVFPALGKLVGA